MITWAIDRVLFFRVEFILLFQMMEFDETGPKTLYFIESMRLFGKRYSICHKMSQIYRKIDKKRVNIIIFNLMLKDPSLSLETNNIAS